MTKASVVVEDQPLGTISPRLYGHFAEHLGRCCYDGLWVGPNGGMPGADGGIIPQTDGFRDDVIAALSDLPAPLLRWPGGCYADHYHWRNGIGAPASRPVTIGMSCGLAVPDTNTLGTHEFLRFCELIGAEPYLAGNVGSGTVQELCDWVEYVNTTVPTSLARERSANGRSEPWGVRLWGIGNEAWDCGGRFDPVTYAHEYRRAAAMIRHVDPRAELVAVGQDDEPLPESGLDPEWNSKFLAALGPAVDLVDHLSIHRYWVRGGPETGFGEEGYYALLDEAAGTERFVERTAATIAAAVAAAARPAHRIGIALDEWGVWHPESRDWGPGDVERRSPVNFEQANTLRDALAAGIALEGFHRQCRVLSMANIAQVVNVLQSVLVTDGPSCIKTPTYHAFWMHRPHVGAEALPVEVEVEGPEAGPAGSPTLSATASIRSGRIAATLINRDYREQAEATIRGVGPFRSGWLLTADSPSATNDAVHPGLVAPRPIEGNSTGPGRWTFSMPPHSLATIEFGANGANHN